MTAVLLTIALLAGTPPGMACEVIESNAARITVACEVPATGKWFVATITRTTGTVTRATGWGS